eukprot:3647342-Karenia_brevis.AAC.1
MFAPLSEENDNYNNDFMDINSQEVVKAHCPRPGRGVHGREPIHSRKKAHCPRPGRGVHGWEPIHSCKKEREVCKDAGHASPVLLHECSSGDLDDNFLPTHGGPTSSTGKVFTVELHHQVGESSVSDNVGLNIKGLDKNNMLRTGDVM